MRGPIVVLALLVTPFVATIASAQDTQPSNPGDKKCAVRERGNSSDSTTRTDPAAQGNKQCTPVTVGHTTISGVAFFDVDRDGLLGVDEVGLSSWQVQLIGPVSTLTTMTDGNGAYSFPNLDAGTYTVCVLPPMGWNQISPTNSTAGGTACATGGFGYTIIVPAVATDATIANINFGYVSQ
jgi:hypothetical protein